MIFLTLCLAAWQTRRMSKSTDAAVLQSLADALDDCLGRLGVLAERHTNTKEDDVLGALLEAERLVRAAGREVQRSRRLLR